MSAVTAPSAGAMSTFTDGSLQALLPGLGQWYNSRSHTAALLGPTHWRHPDRMVSIPEVTVLECLAGRDSERAEQAWLDATRSHLTCVLYYSSYT